MSKHPIRRYEYYTASRCITACLLTTIFALSSLFTIATPTSAAETSSRADTTLEHPLEPPDTSSPRATLKTFLKFSSEGWRFFLEHGEKHPNAENHAGCCLDVSKIPEIQRKDVDIESALMLFDVFNRITLPELEDVPDKEEMDSKEETSWVVPHTPITIAQVAEGPRAGEWLFTPETVEGTPKFYRKTRHLPVKSDAVIDDGYSLYRGQTGWIIPKALYLVLPDSAHKVYFDQTLLQWFLVVIVLTLTGFLAWAGIRWSRHAALGRLASDMRALAAPVIVALLSSVALYILDEQVNITGVTLTVFLHFFDSIFYLAIAWGAILAGRLVINAILASSRIDLTQLSADFVRMSARILSFLVVLIIAAIWLNSLGIPVLGVLAGLGIGGIAIALAAQRTIENFFGAIMLFTDRPVRIGDFCRFGDKMGTVERIGLRSTRIRTLERTILNVPNAEFSRFQLENLAHRDRMLFHSIFNLRLETTSEQLQLVLYRVRSLLLDHGSVYDDPARVRLVAIGPLSLDIEIFAYIKTTDMGEFLAIREDLYLEIMREVEAAGTALAPPAQIQYNETAPSVSPKGGDSSER